MTDRIIVENEGPVMKILFNRPDEGNIFTNEMAARITEAMAGVSGAKVIVLEGRGPDFCLGRDLSTLNLNGPLPEALALRNQNDVIFNCYGSLRNSPVPVVSLVRGRARGFGCALAAIADITLAASDAVFQLPEMGHGIMPGMATSALVDRIPRKALIHLVCSSLPVSAERALAFGLITDIAEPEEFDARAEQLVAALTKPSLPALRAVKDYARSAYNMDMQAATDFARNLHATLNSSSELKK